MIMSEIMSVIYKKDTGEIMAWGDEWQGYGLLGYAPEDFDKAKDIYGIIKIPYNYDLKGNERNSKVVNGTELVIYTGQVTVE